MPSLEVLGKKDGIEEVDLVRVFSVFRGGS